MMEIKIHFQFTGTDRNRIVTGSYINLMSCSTLHYARTKAVNGLNIRASIPFKVYIKAQII